MKIVQTKENFDNLHINVLKLKCVLIYKKNKQLVYFWLVKQVAFLSTKHKTNRNVRLWDRFSVIQKWMTFTALDVTDYFDATVYTVKVHV